MSDRSNWMLGKGPGGWTVLRWLGEDYEGEGSEGKQDPLELLDTSTLDLVEDEPGGYDPYNRSGAKSTR